MHPFHRRALYLSLALPAMAQSSLPQVDEAFFAKADLKTVIATCARKAQGLEPMDGRLSVEFAQCLLAADQPEASAELLKIATTLRPKDSEIPRLEAHGWFLRGDREKALAALAPLRAKARSDMDGYLRAAEDLLEFVGPAEAEAMMELGYQYDRSDVGAFTEFGMHCAPKHPELAVKWLIRGFRKGEWERTHAGAIVLARSGHAQAAGEVFEVVFQSHKGENADWLELAKEAGRQGAVEWRAKYVARYKELEFRKPGAFEKVAATPSAGRRIEVGIVKLLEGDRAGAEAAFASVRTLPDAKPEDAYQIAGAWLLVKDPDAALRCLEGTSATQISNPSALAEAGKVYLALGRIPQAEACMARSFDLDPKDWDRARDFGWAALEAGQADLAARWLTRPGAPKKGKEHLGLAAIRLLDQGHRGEAERVMEAAFQLDPRDWPNCTEFGRAAVRNGHRDLAARYFARGVQYNPTSGRMWNEIALAFAEGGKGIRNEFHLD